MSESNSLPAFGFPEKWTFILSLFLASVIVTIFAFNTGVHHRNLFLLLLHFFFHRFLDGLCVDGLH